jgi:hypothetical protein
MRNKITKITLLCVGLSCSVHADGIREAYVKDGGKSDEQYATELFNKSIRFLEGDGPKRTVEIGTNKMDVIDYRSALDGFEESAFKENNPMSAYAALHIIDSFSIKQDVQKKNKLVKILNETQDFCIARIWWGDLYYRGVNEKIDKKKAHEIYSTIDPSTCNDWQKNVLFSRLNATKPKQ